MPKIVANKLNAKFVETVTTPGYYLDGDGLHLQVVAGTGKDNAGALVKTWVRVFKSPVTGKRREGGLGSYSSPNRKITLQEAREKNRKEWTYAIDAGLDPIEEREKRKLSARIEQSRTKTFKDCAETYLRLHRKGWRNEKHAAQWASTLKTYVFPKLGSMPVAAIDTDHVMAALEPIWTEKTETASRVRQRMEQVLSWAEAKKYRAGPNPARWKGHLDKLLPKRSKVAPVEHHPSLPYVQIGGFMKALKGQEGIAPRALEFAILTAARAGEVVGMKWSEIDWHAKEWNIPGERMKAGRPHRVPLTTPTLAILRKLEETKASEYVFPGMREGEPLSNGALGAVIDRMNEADGAKEPRYTDKAGNAIVPHGFRGTFKTWCAEQTAFPAFVAEMAMAHAIQGIEKHYQHGDLLEKRRKLMEAWAAHCGKTTTTASVVPIRKAR